MVIGGVFQLIFMIIMIKKYNKLIIGDYNSYISSKLYKLSNQVLMLDDGTNSLNFKSGNLVGLSIAYDIGESVYIPLRHINNDNDLFENKNI